MEENKLLNLDELKNVTGGALTENDYEIIKSMVKGILLAGKDPNETNELMLETLYKGKETGRIGNYENTEAERNRIWEIIEGTYNELRASGKIK